MSLLEMREILPSKGPDINISFLVDYVIRLLVKIWDNTRFLLFSPGGILFKNIIKQNLNINKAKLETPRKSVINLNPFNVNFPITEKLNSCQKRFMYSSAAAHFECARKFCFKCTTISIEFYLDYSCQYFNIKFDYLWINLVCIFCTAPIKPILLVCFKYLYDLSYFLTHV